MQGPAKALSRRFCSTALHGRFSWASGATATGCSPRTKAFLTGSRPFEIQKWQMCLEFVLGPFLAGNGPFLEISGPPRPFTVPRWQNVVEFLLGCRRPTNGRF